MKKYYFITLILFGCNIESEIYQPKYEPELYINSILTAGDQLEVSIYRTFGFNEPESLHYQVLPEGKVVISSDLLSDTLKVIDSMSNAIRFYRSVSNKAKTNKEYTLYVNVPGFEVITSRTIIPEVVNIDSVEVNLVENSQYYFEMNIDVYFTDPVTDENFYFLRVSDELFKSFYGIEAQMAERPCCDRSYSDAAFNGQSKKFRVIIDEDIRKYEGTDLHTNYYKPGKKIRVDLVSITESHYDFLHQFAYTSNAELESDFFFEPISLVTNIKGGYGIFTGTSESTVILDLDSLTAGMD